MLRVRGLRYTYAGSDTPALRGLDFAVESGEVFGFLGPSGAGKTTTQKVLVGLLDDYEGSAEVLDREVRDWGRDLYTHIGVSSETPNLYRKLSGRENLELFASLHGGASRDPDALLERVGLADAAARRVGTYSKGMRARLDFVRALLHDPELVFLDEPTAGIDPGTARSVKAMVEELAGEDGRTVFLTTHDMTVADQLCDRVGFVVDGSLPVVDTPRALKLDHGEPTVRVEYRVDGTLDARTFPLDALGDPAFHDLLASERVETIHTEEATLEDVFVAVTGATLT